ncbi:MAG: HNH endonuclease [Myxococcales bacterium]
MSNARIFADRLADLLRCEHAAMAEFLVALAKFDECKAWMELGYSSLFYFLHRELGLSKGAAHYRKTATDVIRRFPETVEPLRDGRLCITSIVQLAKVLTQENRHETLPKFFQRSRRESIAIVAALHPVDAVPQRDVVTTLRHHPAQLFTDTVGRLAVATQVDPVQPVEPNVCLSTNVEGSKSTTASVPHASRDTDEPLTGELSRLHVTVSRRFLEKLEAARGALSHSRPGASTEDILETGIDLVLQRHARRKGLVEKPRQGMPSASPSALSAAVKRKVWTRDGGRCQWPIESGGICGSNFRLEFDHRIPRARAGPSTTENVRLLRRFHNDLAARRAFGNDWMDQFTGNGAPQ